MAITPSPNFWKGRKNFTPEAIVLHIAEGSAKSCIDWFLKPESAVSAHYLVCKNGAIIKFVDEVDTAWHAGKAVKPEWKLLKKGVNPNLYTIGIEFEGFAGEPMCLLQAQAGARLIAEVAARWNITLDEDHVIGHRLINGSKSCPGSGILIGYLIRRAAMEAEIMKI